MTATATTPMPKLKAPFPYFGGKSRVAGLVWERFGDVKNYVEPFAGSLAVLLNRPTPPHIETVNDLDCHIANFWRALQADPVAVARYADWPVNEADLHARHLWITQQAEFRERMKTDPDYYDAKIAGWWVWGLSSWICSNFCRVTPQKSLPHLGPPLGVNSQSRRDLTGYMQQLADRLRRVRVCCGDWKRVCSKAVTFGHGLTGVLLDPPYDTRNGCSKVYTNNDDSVSGVVREWAVENGDNPLLRIAVCGYEGEHTFPESWECVAWKAAGGYGNQSKSGNGNKHRERIWFSPHCIHPDADLLSWCRRLAT